MTKKPTPLPTQTSERVHLSLAAAETRWSPNEVPNARIDTIIRDLKHKTGGTWGDAFRYRRCLIPMSGFYEWPKDGLKGQAPYLIERADGKPMIMAGMYLGQTDTKTGLKEYRFVVTTCEPNALMSSIPHDRMPVILDPRDAKMFLNGTVEQAIALCVPCPDEWLRKRRVSARVNNWRNDDPSILQPDPETEPAAEANPEPETHGEPELPL